MVPHSLFIGTCISSLVVAESPIGLMTLFSSSFVLVSLFGWRRHLVAEIQLGFDLNFGLDLARIMATPHFRMIKYSLWPWHA